MKLRVLAMSAATAVVIVGGSLTQAHGATSGVIRHAGRPAICSKSFNPYKQQVSVLRSCGDRIEWLKHVTTLPGGGKAYSYGDYTTLVPPAHFNVLKASDKRLSEYGFPTRKQLGPQWYKLMRRVRSFAQPTPYLVENPNIRIDPAVPAGRNGAAPLTSDSPVWAGYDVHNHSYTEVTATWTEPQFAPAPCSGDAFLQWVGIGGWYGPYLGQDGTAWNIPGWAAHQGWIETINNDNAPAVPVNIVAKPGDSFYASTLWDPQLSKFFYYMMDNGNSSSNESRPVTANQQSVEVISERPTLSGRYAELSNFQVVAVQQDRAYWNSSSSGFYYDSANPIYMYDTYHNLLAYPSQMATDSSFSTHWNNRCN